MYTVYRSPEHPIRVSDYEEAKRLAIELKGQIYLSYLATDHLIYSYLFQHPEFKNVESTFEGTRRFILEQLQMVPEGELT